MPPKRVLITGPPRSGRDEYVRKALGLSERGEEACDTKSFNGHEVSYHYVFGYMKEIAWERYKRRISRERVFDLPKYRLDELRELSFEKIVNVVKEGNDRTHVVSTASLFRIRPRATYYDGRIEGITEGFLRDFDPDLVLVFIDDLLRIKRRIEGDSYWRSQVNPTLKTLAEWREQATRVIEDYFMEVVRVKQPPFKWLEYPYGLSERALTDLIFTDKPLLYVSYHITGASPEEINYVQNFIKRLQENFIAFDPYAVKDWDVVHAYDEAKEKGYSEVKVSYDNEDVRLSMDEVEEAIDSIRSQIVKRDFKLIQASDAVVVYHHRPEPSYGVMAEIVYASTVAGTPVFVLYPFRKRPSPFLEHFVGPDRIFREQGREELESQVIKALRDEIKERELV